MMLLTLLLKLLKPNSAKINLLL